MFLMIKQDKTQKIRVPLMIGHGTVPCPSMSFRLTTWNNMREIHGKQLFSLVSCIFSILSIYAYIFALGCKVTINKWIM